MTDFLFDEGKNKIEGLNKNAINEALQSKADAQAVANAFQSVNEALNGKASTQALNEAIENINSELDNKADADDINSIEKDIDYLSYIETQLTENKYADYQNKVIGTLNGINLLTFNVENVSKILYNYTITTPDLRGLFFTDINNVGIFGYQAIAETQEIIVPTGAVMCFASVNTINDILCYDIYGSLAKFRNTMNEFSTIVNEVVDVLEGDQPIEILKSQATYINKTSGGITYTWNSDNSKVSIVGKRTATSFNKMCGSASSLPNNMNAGGTYTVDFEALNPNIVLNFLLYENGVNVSSKYFNGKEVYTIPITTTGIEIRLQVINPNSEVNEIVNCPSIYTIPEGIGLVERVVNLENAVFGNDENPLSKIVEGGGLLSIFHKVGCIGDSLASGECAYKTNGETHYIDMYQFSWGQCLSRITGNTYYNFSQGGLTTKTWLESAHATTCFDGDHNCDCYFIGLGQNDKNVSMTVGTTADIDLNDYNNNADTYCGNYGKIIQKIKELQPKAHIFCFIDPNPPHDDQNYNNAVKEIILLFENVWTIDLDKYAKNLYRDSNEIIGSQLRAGHYSALGYQEMAFIIASYVDWIIKNNLVEFSQVEFIGTNYSY